MDRAWLEQWRASMRDCLDQLTASFESRFGFPPGEHSITDGDTADTTLPADLLLFHQVIAEVQLPDVDIGYWIHRPTKDQGYPYALSDGRRVTVFGSDGGGALFALATSSGGPVLRLADGALVDGVYDTENAVEIAEDLQTLLIFLHQKTTEFCRGTST
ncbi:hypothetical protein ACWKSP_23750 [Micromonosporaceae bacterium Da 78-11]